MIWRKKHATERDADSASLALVIACDPDWLEPAPKFGQAPAELIASSILRRLGAEVRDVIVDVCGSEAAVQWHWWGSLTPLDVTVSGALAGHPAGPLHRVTLSSDVVSFASLADARSYAFYHNGAASTTYAWVYDDVGNVSVQSSVLVRPGDERSLRFAAQVASELYATALGKFVYALQQVGQGNEQWRMPEGSAKPDDFDPQRLPAVLRTNEQLLTYGNLTGNAWAGLDERYLSNWAAGRFAEFHILFDGDGVAAKNECLLPFIDAVAHPDRFPAYQLPFALLRCVPDTHPYIGPGLLCTTTLTTSLAVDQAVEHCNQLNRADLHGASGATCAGTWMVDPTSFDPAKPNENYICFHSFFASAYQSTLQLDDLADEAFRRVQFAVRSLSL